MTVNAVEVVNYNRERTYTIKFEIFYEDSSDIRTNIVNDFIFEFIIACGEISSSISDPMLNADLD